MYYSSFGILAVIHHIIINHDVLKRGKNELPESPRYRYRQFLNALLIFYIADLMWGFLVDAKIRLFAYTDTMLFFITMALSVLLWTRYVVAFLDKNGLKAKAFIGAGWAIFGFVIVSLIVNFFKPFIFDFSPETEYTPFPARHLLLILQLILFMLISIYSFFVSRKQEGRQRVRYQAVAVSGGVMAVLIFVQSFFPFAPFYTIGCMIANSLLHVFVEEDEKKEQDRITAYAQKEREIFSQVSQAFANDYDAIYYINIETGKYREISSSILYQSMNVPSEGKDFYEETRENARRYAHPDDRAFAESMYYKETMLKNLEGRTSFSYKYRIMVGDEARYFRFNVMLAADGMHLILTDKDIHDTITAETAMLEEKKAIITFSQIAESLASNYDVIYYVDMETGNYTGYTSKNIFGELQVDESGEDFFGDSLINIKRMIHPQDRDYLSASLSRDNLITSLEKRKQYELRYRLNIDERVEHTRMSIRKSSDGRHIIVGVENIEDEVKKEHEHLRALNTEKELARRDELTGTRNKTAFSELEQSIQENIEKGMNYLPFALAVCDLNNLKMINDTVGHKAGDEYIVASAKLLCDVFDHSPVFRIGGDEFVIFLRGDDYTARDELIEKIRRTSSENRDRNNGPVIAIGMSEYDPGNDYNISEIFDRADHLMYEDKHKLKQQ